MALTLTRCADCGRNWSALSECHCTMCHQHFAGVTFFDWHLRDDRCLTPADLREKGLVQKRDRYGGRTWRRPGQYWT